MPILAPIIISQFGPPALSAIRSWGRRGARVGLIQIVAEGEPVPRSRYLADHIAVTADEFMNGDGFARALTFIRDFNADLLLTISEQFACLLDENRHLLPDNMQLMFSGAETTRAILSKSLQIAPRRRLDLTTHQPRTRRTRLAQHPILGHLRNLYRSMYKPHVLPATHRCCRPFTRKTCPS